ncbi:hypothetical protein Ahy_A10g047264 [Arachis hypogaea]|uniref:Transposase MuDR plant domain-containing protein n=1 Tax=Arachis hypogaea TaxID=3818 RepID=A0A445B214_ARAHY|nr:hypothetical protein Ahy_A10g047264 [Arachis hypogaea]
MSYLVSFLAFNSVKKVRLVEVEIMEGIANMRVYFNCEIIPNTYEGVTFVCKCPFLFTIPCTMSFVELQNGFCENIQSHISKRVNNILYRNHVQVFGGMIQFQLMSITDDACMQRMFYIYQQIRFHVPMIELYVEFEQYTGMDVVGDDVNVDELRDIDWEEDNDSEEEFEANYEVDNENDDGDLAGNPVVQNDADAIVSRHPFGVPSFMRTLDLEAMHAPEFSEYCEYRGSFVIGGGNVAVKDGRFSVGMEFGSTKSVISAIKSYTISRGIDYTMYESEPQTFYTKCKSYGARCDWLIRASLIRKKGCWEIRRYNDKHTCTMGAISQDHVKLDSDTIANAIRPLVEADPSINVKSILFNYTVSYRKAWLAKEKAVARGYMLPPLAVAKVFGDWEVSYQTLLVWLKAMTAKMPRSRVQIKTLPSKGRNFEFNEVINLSRNTTVPSTQKM